MKGNGTHENVFIRFAKKVLGVILIIIGIIGLFLPFLQGIAMILLGLMLLCGKPVVRRCFLFLNYVRNLWRPIKRNNRHTPGSG